jgi:excisionase family DNA binding protein
MTELLKNELLTTNEFGELLRLSGHTIRRLCRKGELKCLRVGELGQWRVFASEYEAIKNGKKYEKS